MKAFFKPVPKAAQQKAVPTMAGFARKMHDVLQVKRRLDLDRWPSRCSSFPITAEDTKKGAGGAFGAYGGCVAMWMDAQEPRPTPDAAKHFFSNKDTGLWTLRVKQLTGKKQAAAIEEIRTELLEALRQRNASEQDDLVELFDAVVNNAERVHEDMLEDDTMKKEHFGAQLKHFQKIRKVVYSTYGIVYS